MSGRKKAIPGKTLPWRFFVILVLAIPTAVAADNGSQLSRQLGTFLEWFPGEYDNYEQVWRDGL